MTSPTQGEHAQTEALPTITRYKIGYPTDSWGERSSTPSGIPDHAGAWVRYEDHAAQVAALTAAEPAPAVKREFTNELGNSIRITVEGPNSMHENIVTPMEAEQLREALNEHAQKSAPAGVTPACLTCNDHGAVGNILTAEPCPDCTPAQPAAPQGVAEVNWWEADGDKYDASISPMQPAQGVAYAELRKEFDLWWNDQMGNEPGRDTSSDSRAFMPYKAWKKATERASHGQAPAGATYEKELEEALRERDDADDFIDALLDEVLGADRAEWSSAYGRADALEEVRERITALHKPAVDRTWAQFETATQQVCASVTVSVGSQEFDLAETGAHFTTADMATACGQAFREGQAAQQVGEVAFDAAMRAIQQAIGLIGEPDSDRLRAVRRVLRGAVIVVEDNAPQPSPEAQPAPAAGAVAGPAEPTQEMIAAVLRLVDLGQSDPEDHRYDDGSKLATQICRAVLAAAPTPAAQADSKPMLRDWVTSDDPVQALDAIMAVYEKCMGTTPGPEMAHVVSKTKEMLFDWWGRYRELAREALIKADSVLDDAAQESEYRRGYRHGYERRDAEVRGALA